jgi:hypothetical protein
MHETELLAAVGLRHLERLFVVCSGMLSIWLGYRLFLAMPTAARGDGEIKLPGGISIFLSRVGPGVFFALFGAMVVAFALHEAVKINTSTPVEDAVAGGTPTKSTAGEKFEYSGVASASSSGEERVSERMNAVATVGQLARLSDALDAPSGRGVEHRSDARIALGEARVRLLAGVWDDREWGPFAAFHLWWESGEASPPPVGVQVAAQIYRGGK